MSVLLGANHQFLYPEAMRDAEAHTRTLRLLAENKDIAALDCWVWPETARAREELAILRGCGKQIHYNIGDRPMDEVCFPASPDGARRTRAVALLLREFGYANACGAKKIILGSGPDLPEDRAAGIERFAEVLLRMNNATDPRVTIALEPVDRDIDKRMLFGPVPETTSFIQQMRAAGMCNFGMLLDMAHIPLMHATLQSAVADARPVLEHVHLGNCILKNPANPFYGDKHICWGWEDGEFEEQDGVTMMQLLQDCGYLARENATVSFEMRPVKACSPEDSLCRWCDVIRPFLNV